MRDPLTRTLLILTFVTGIVDAVCDGGQLNLKFAGNSFRRLLYGETHTT